MCRWLAYLGSPVEIADILVRPNHSLIDQSLHARELFLPNDPLAAQFAHHAFPTNGDGFGMAWAGRAGALGQYRQLGPAWDSQNLKHLAQQLESGCFLAHVRAAPGGTIAEQNCHPFVDHGWMFQHNGSIPNFREIKRELTFDVDPQLYPGILGNSDTELCFYLALTYGLEHDPVTALSRMVARVERARNEQQIQAPFRATVCASDGKHLVVLRWVSPQGSNELAPSLYHAAGSTILHGIEGEKLSLPTDAQLVVSEPLSLHWSRHTWVEIPPGTISVFEQGRPPHIEPVNLGL